MAKHGFAAMLCSSTALLAVTTAWAQEPTSAQTSQSGEQATTVDEIVVTAQRRSQGVLSVPMSITAVSGEDLSTLGITDVADLVRVTPGLSAVESGASVPVYSLRGVGFFDTSIAARPTVSIYQDEVPLPFSIMTSGASFDLQRVEVLKGPQGTLFGQNSTGGAINYIANRPSDIFEAGVTLDYSSYDRVQAEGYVSGPVSDTLGMRLALRTDQGGDWQRSYTRDDAHGARRYLQGRFIADWHPSDRVGLSFTLSGFQDQSDTQAAQLTNVILQRPVSGPQVPLIIAYPTSPMDARSADWNDAGFPLERDNTFYQAAIRGEYWINDNLRIVSLTSYADMDVHQRVDLDATSIAAAFTENRGAATSVAQELRLIGEYDRLNWVVGASYADDKVSQIDDYSIPYTTGTFSIPTGRFSRFSLDSDQAFETTALFGNVEYELTETLTASLGARYTQADLSYVACSRVGNQETANTLTAFFNILRGPTRPLPSALQIGDCLTVDATTTPGQVTGELNEDSVSWRVNLSWSPAPRTLFYANASQGYKAGSGPVLPALASNQLSPVVQESVLAYELGFRVPFYNNMFDASGAVFYYDYADKQLKSRTLVEPAVLGALEAIVNVPESRIQGAELQINARPMDGLTFSITGTYIDSEVTSDFIGYTVLGVQDDFQGEAFPYTPELQVVANARYDWRVGGMDAFISTNVNYRSETVAGFGQNPVLEIDSYATVDLQGGVTTANGDWQVVAYVHNLTDEYYWTNVARLNDTVRRYSGMSRTMGVRLTRTF
ncbi:TonB-dependent receptor [Brevundimonas abyssalis]|uniref:TonB-dependent receptor n=1 Tax=Brevundimonas abyssalis TaxID=1125965 RepID=UPI0005EC4395|nr:TonB-dependent receptor [Brevundimonas abyssalis]